MRKNWRSETHGNRGLWDEGGVRNVESSRENILIEAVDVSVEGQNHGWRHAPFSRTNQRRSCE